MKNKIINIHKFMIKVNLNQNKKLKKEENILKLQMKKLNINAKKRIVKKFIYPKELLYNTLK